MALPPSSNPSLAPPAHYLIAIAAEKFPPHQRGSTHPTLMSDLKKRKVASTVAARQSRIFSPFRVVGNVSNETPFAVGTLGSTFYIVTSVGRSFQIYDAATLHLLFVLQSQTPARITCLAAHFHHVYAAHGNVVGIYKRGRLVDSVTCPDPEAVNCLLVFGSYLVATTASQVHIFKNPAGGALPTEHYTTLHINRQLDGDIVRAIHPPTYLNKVVVATAGHLFIFNVRTGKLVFRTPDQQFAAAAATATATGGSISYVEAAPVLDVVAVGTTTGHVVLYNLKKARVLSCIHAAGEGAAKVSSLSFRTDGSAHLAAGLSSGALFFYDLERRARLHLVGGAHREELGGVARAAFLNGQPVVVTNGGDNHLKEWVFDPSLAALSNAVVAPPRHLRSRGGHLAPPVAIEFPQEEKVHFMLSASRDRTFWSFSLRKDAQAQEFSQRPQKGALGKRTGGPLIREKFPEITALATLPARLDDWEDVLTGHRDERFARTWSSKTKRVGRHQLATTDGGSVRAVAISHCGNFGLVGSLEGAIALYNLQSGLIRKKYILHKRAVLGLAIDGMNRLMVSTGLDGVVGFYDFTQLKYLGKLQLEAPITAMRYHKGLDLIVCALDDLSLVVVDVVTQRVVRCLYGHSNRITLMDFLPDGRWVVLVALDGTLRTWDLPTGGCIDGIRLPSVATLVRFLPLGDMIATAHVGGTGVSLWTNRAQFRGPGSVSTRHVEEEEFLTALLPNVSGDGGSGMLDGALDEPVPEEFSGQYASVDQIDALLVTLTVSEAKSKYSTLLNLDTIRQRNKPTEPPKKPESAPFFLQLAGEKVGDRASVAEGKVAHSDAAEELAATPATVAVGSRLFESEFTRLLRECAQSGDYSAFLTHFALLPPSSMDLEIRSLNTMPPLTELVHFVTAVTRGLEQNKNYDIYQVVFSLFLKHHGDVVKAHSDNAKLAAALEQWTQANAPSSDRMDELVKYCSGVIGFLTTV